MKFRDWRINKVLTEAKELLEQFPVGVRDQVMKDLEAEMGGGRRSGSADPRKRLISKKRGMMRKLQDQIDRIKDGQKSLKDEMDRDPELEAKHRDLFDELDDKKWEYIEKRNDLEQDIEYIQDEVEDEDLEDWDDDEEEEEDKGVSDKAEKHLKDTETKKSIAKQTKEIKDMEERIEKTKKSMEFSKRAQTASGWTDSQREREKRNLEHNTKKLKEYEQKLKELVARHKEATGQ
jgi:chromosome segregation ATPase